MKKKLKNIWLTCNKCKNIFKTTDLWIEKHGEPKICKNCVKNNIDISSSHLTGRYTHNMDGE